jgi:hypothetical protein
MNRPSIRLLLPAAALAVMQAALLLEIHASTPSILLHDSSGRVLDRVFAGINARVGLVAASRRLVLSSEHRGCQIDPGIKLASYGGTERDLCEYCYFMSGPYGCNDSLCYDSLCQYVGVCYGCNAYYDPGCSGCAQDQECVCCE